MLIQPLMDKLDHLRLYGLRAALADQLFSAQYADLSFEDRLGLLVDAEWTARTNANFKRRLKAAQLHQEASIEDLDMATARGLDRAQMLSLAAGDWIALTLGVIVLGPTGSGRPSLPVRWAMPLAAWTTRCASSDYAACSSASL